MKVRDIISDPPEKGDEYLPVEVVPVRPLEDLPKRKDTARDRDMIRKHEMYAARGRKKPFTPKTAYNYLKRMLKARTGPLPVSTELKHELEDVVGKSGILSYKYAIHFVKDRFPPGENAIFADLHLAALYMEFLRKVNPDAVRDLIRVRRRSS